MFNKSGSKLSIVAASLVLAGWAIAAQTTPDASKRDDSKFLCSMDGKINSIGAFISVNGNSYRCTTVLEERGVSKAAWVQVKMSASIVTD